VDVHPTHCHQVCHLLKSLLDDDHDMWGLNLSAKEAQRVAAQEAAVHMMEVAAMAQAAQAVAPALDKVSETYGLIALHLLMLLVGLMPCGGMWASHAASLAFKGSSSA